MTKRMDVLQERNSKLSDERSRPGDQRERDPQQQRRIDLVSFKDSNNPIWCRKVARPEKELPFLFSHP